MLKKSSKKGKNLSNSKKKLGKKTYILIGKKLFKPSGKLGEENQKHLLLAPKRVSKQSR